MRGESRYKVRQIQDRMRTAILTTLLLAVCSLACKKDDYRHWTHITLRQESGLDSDRFLSVARKAAEKQGCSQLEESPGYIGLDGALEDVRGEAFGCGDAGFELREALNGLPELLLSQRGAVPSEHYLSVRSKLLEDLKREFGSSLRVSGPRCAICPTEGLTESSG